MKKAGPAIRRPDAKKPPGVGKGSGANGAGSGTLTPEDQARLDQRIRLAREKWMREMRIAQAKKDEQEAAKKLAEMEAALGSKLPPELREELVARVSAERASVLLQWVTANPKADLTSLSPKTRTELARMIDRSRIRAQDAWAAEKRAMLVERARRAKGGGDGDAGKGADGGEKQRAGDVRRLKKKRGVVVQPAGSKPRAKGSWRPGSCAGEEGPGREGACHQEGLHAPGGPGRGRQRQVRDRQEGLTRPRAGLVGVAPDERGPLSWSGSGPLSSARRRGARKKRTHPPFPDAWVSVVPPSTFASAGGASAVDQKTELSAVEFSSTSLVPACQWKPSS